MPALKKNYRQYIPKKYKDKVDVRAKEDRGKAEAEKKKEP